MLLWTPEDLFLPIKPDLHLLLLLHPLSSGHPAVHSFPLISSMTFLIDALLLPSALVICSLISPLHFMSYCPSNLCSGVAAQVFFDGSSKHLLHTGEKSQEKKKTITFVQMESCWIKSANGPHADPLARLNCSHLHFYSLSLSLSRSC